MFFVTTAAIGGSLMAVAFLIQDGLAAAGLAALMVGLASAALAASVLAQVERRAGAGRYAGSGPAAGRPGPAIDDLPRLARRRVAGTFPPHHPRPGAARFAPAL